MSRCLGKLPARESHPARMRAGKALTSWATANASAGPIDFTGGVNDWGMLRNDTVGDCAIVAILHAQMAWYACNGGHYHPTDDDAISLYSAITGYDPENPFTDRGAYMTDVLAYAETLGMGAARIDAHVPIALDPEAIGSTVLVTGGAYLGLRLPLTVKRASEWTDLTGERGSWGGHAVWVAKVDARGAWVVSWGKLMFASWAFIEKYADEAHAVLCERLWDPGERGPNGFPHEAIRAELAALGRMF